MARDHGPTNRAGAQLHSCEKGSGTAIKEEGNHGINSQEGSFQFRRAGEAAVWIAPSENFAPQGTASTTPSTVTPFSKRP